MAIATTRTLLPLDTFARILGINPLHFNGVHLPSSDVPNQCESPFVQFAYQDSDRVGREEIAQAIADAEMQIIDLLNFSPIEDYFESYLDFGGKYSPSYNTPVMRVPRGYIIEAGIQSKTLLHAAAPVVFTNVEPDNPDELEAGIFYETALIQANVPLGTDSNEIRIYYPGYNGDDVYEIRPITKIDIVGTQANIYVPTAQLVLLDRFMGLNFFPVDGTDNSNFLTTVDVYRVYTDNTIQVNYEYYPGRCLDNAACQPTGRLFIRDARLGMVYSAPATWDATALAWTDANWCACGFPAGAHVNYKAGLIGRDSAVWQRAIAYYALSLLDRPVCACESVKAAAKHWSDDLAITETNEGNSRTITLAPGLLNNPLGTTRGAIYAWRLIQRQGLGEVV